MTDGPNNKRLRMEHAFLMVVCESVSRNAIKLWKARKTWLSECKRFQPKAHKILMKMWPGEASRLSGPATVCFAAWVTRFRRLCGNLGA